MDNSETEREPAHITHKSDSIIYGLRPVMEAINAGKEIESVFINDKAKGERMNELKVLLKKNNISWREVPYGKLNRLTRMNHQDVVCVISPISYHSLHSVVASVFDKGEMPLIMVLDRITDVRNFGAITRTAECAGVHAIVIPYRGAAQINSDAVKTSSGALNIVPVCREKNLSTAIDYLKESGLQIIACTEKAKEDYFKTDFTTPTTIILGSEEDGISKELLEKADRKVSIPLAGKIESLNVSVAAGIILYEAVRQKS
ncbi:MAG: 23S rRNA (guanosine(2251)-2'-O)-methyltransferase RlmB [Bacteroidia bacterium]|nr:23S rRNA (guanosine(2251)-2'-O)-methyltransferase RlmB [Bacteroidia bacterium]